MESYALYLLFTTSHAPLNINLHHISNNPEHNNMFVIVNYLFCLRSKIKT